ncbi:MAG: fasciclin domain-containing protein [Hyphomicrobium sp.]
MEKQSLKAAAESSGVLTRMIEATKLAGLDEPDADIGPLTIFAPSDDAFAALPERLRTKLLAPENRAQLAIILMHHAIPGEFSTERLLKASARHYAVDAVDGSLVEITTRRGIDVDGAKIIKPDILASDGIIHIIDKVLIPKAVLAELDAQVAVTTVAAGSQQSE